LERVYNFGISKPMTQKERNEGFWFLGCHILTKVDKLTSMKITV